MGARRKAREYALQALYLSDLSQFSAEEAMRRIFKQENVDPEVENFAAYLAKNTAEHKEAIDALIIKNAANWDMPRMATIDRNILRLAAYELLFELKTPTSVVINEAVELAKLFSTEDSGKFVNGLLDQIKKERTTEKNEPAEKKPSDA